MEVIVVVRQCLNNIGWTTQAGIGTNEYELRSSCNKSIDEGLGQPLVDLGGSTRFQFSVIPTRIVNVNVESVLVRAVTESSELRTKVSSVFPAEIADSNTRRARVVGSK